MTLAFKSLTLLTLLSAYPAYCLLTLLAHALPVCLFVSVCLSLSLFSQHLQFFSYGDWPPLLVKGCFIAHDSWLPWKRISMYFCQNISILRNFLREHFLKLNLLQLSKSMFCKNVAYLAVARGCSTWIHSLATAKRATFLQNIL